MKVSPHYWHREWKKIHDSKKKNYLDFQEKKSFIEHELEREIKARINNYETASFK